MNFRPHDRDEPELNLIPLIDVLIILLIFLVMTTTFAQQRSLNINLPESGAPTTPIREKRISLSIDSSGHFRIDGKLVNTVHGDELKIALRLAAGTEKDPVVVIEADRQSTHQALIGALDALGQLGFQRISFATVPLTSH